MIREVLKGNGVIVALGLLVGAVAVFESVAPAVAFAGLAFLVASIYRPALPVGFAFLGIFLDARGMTGIRVLGLPLTLSKMSVLFAFGAYFVHAMMTRKPIVRITPVTSGMVAVVVAMITSLIAAVDPSLGYIDMIGVIMLVFMCHLIYQSVDDEILPWLFRLMAFVTILLLLWTLFTQRKQGFFVTLDHAWQQRTNGSFGDPNAWSTALLCACPMLIGALSYDRHPTATPLLMGVMATFPACIFQSMSRAGLLSFLVIVPGLIYILRERRTLLLIAGAALLVMLPFVINIDAALLRYATLFNPTLEADLGHGSLREREELLKAGVKIFLENPVLGVGVGLFRMHASYVSAGLVWKIAHNSYINVAAEQGIPGILAHLFLGYQLYRSAWHAAIRSDTHYTRSIGQGFLLSLLAFSVMAFTLNLATFAMAWFMLGLGLGVARLGNSEYITPRVERLKAAERAVVEEDSTRLPVPVSESPA